MAILGVGDYRCEACRNFNADGLDGNHPYCMCEFGAKLVTDECSMFEFGIPRGYEATDKDRAERAHRVTEMLRERGEGE